MSTYDETTDPGSHLSTFNTVMRANNVGFELRYISFHVTLTGPTNSWFDKFRRHSIKFWDQLSSVFKKQFRASITIKPEPSSLANINQKPSETLKQYLPKFNIEVARARGMDDSSHFMAIRASILLASLFKKYLQRNLVYTLTEFIKRAQCAVNLEEARLLLNNPDASTSAEKNPNVCSGQQQQVQES